MSKLVTTVRRVDENLRLLALTYEAKRKGRVVCFGMGRLGAQSRILSPIYGATFTFASLDEQRTVAPGQISVERMRQIYKDMGYS